MEIIIIITIIYKEWTDLPEEEKKNLRNFHLQGSLILQGIMKMPQEENSIVINR